ncbi:MAG: hypothetical protein ACJ79D_17105 [Myxococcales bacterium]
MRCRRCSHDLSSGADRCLRCFALNPQNVAGPLFAGLDSDPPQEVRIRFDDDPVPGVALPEKTLLPPRPRKAAVPAPPLLPFVANTPEPVASVEIANPAVCAAQTPAPVAERSRSPRLPVGTLLLAWAIDFALVAALTLLHATLAVAILDPERLAPGRAGSFDYWLDLFRGGGGSLLWILLLATLGLAYCAFSALLLGRTPGLALATVSRLPRERSAP